MRLVYKCTKVLTALEAEAECKQSQDFRCPDCGRLLFRGEVIQIETRCPRCKRLVRFRRSR